MTSTAKYTHPLMYDTILYAGTNIGDKPMDVIDANRGSDRDLIHALSRISGTHKVLPVFGRRVGGVLTEVEVHLNPDTSGSHFELNRQEGFTLDSVITGSQAAKYLQFN